MSSRFPNFPTPHCHPQSLDSGSTPEAFAEREVELGTGTLTCTDHGTMQATRKIYELAKANSLIPITGIEGYFRDDNCPILQAAGIPKNEAGSYKDYLKYQHVTVHFLDNEAYSAGIRLLSLADLRAEKHGSERKPLWSWENLQELGGYNVTIGSGCLIGMVQRHILAYENLTIATKYYEKLRGLVKPGNFYVELFPHDCSQNWVAGVFITVRAEDGTTKQLKFHAGKWLKTDHGEIRAAKLASDFSKGEHKTLLAVKHYHKWEDLVPGTIVGAEDKEGFVQNECTFWAPNGDAQAGLNKVMKGLAKRYGDKLIVADDSHFALPEEKIVQDVRLSQFGNWRFSNSYHRMDSEEAFAHFQKSLGTTETEFRSWVDNNIEWADRFKNFTIDSKPELPTKFYEEKYEVYTWKTNPKVPTHDHSLMYTMELIKKHGRMDWKNKDYVDRLQAEIKLLHNNGTIDLLPYFFIDEEVCEFYEKRGLLSGPGRGSAGGVLLSYLIGITHVDPIRYELSLERFITLDRIRSGKFPDIDQDLPKTGRELLTDPETGWLKQRFGDHYAQISTDTTLKLRMAVQDVARFLLGHLPPDVVALTKKFQMPPQGVQDYDFVLGYETDEGHVPGSIDSDPALREYIRLYPKHWEVVLKVLGLPRQKGRHACAVAIANRPIHEIIPLTTVSDVKVTSYTAAGVEAAGCLKMDFLGINSLNDIQDAIQLIQERHAHEVDMSDYQIIRHEDGLVGWSGPKFVDGRFSVVLDGKRVPSQRLVPVNGALHDLWDLPPDNKVFADIACGRTETVFQFNTPGAVQWLGHFGKQRDDGSYPIDSIESMAAFTALDRPGPLDMFVPNPDDPSKKHNLLVEYARRARGDAPSKGILPVFDELAPETYGVLTFQETLQRIYQSLTGCSGAEAEEFRSDIAKKKKSKIEKAYKPFIEKAGATIGKDNAEAAWQFFVTWAKYGFNKSHAVCYSVIAYGCAYLKHHYPLEWWTAVLRNADKNEINEKFWKYVRHLIDLPDVTFSGPHFEIQNERIRAPLSLLHGVGESAHTQLIKYGPFKDLADFCNKIEQCREDNKYPVKKTVGENGRVKWIKCEESEAEKYRKGNNALNRGVVYSLIIVGAMDSILPKDENLTIADHLMAYEQALATAQAPPGRKKPPKPKAIDPTLANLSALNRFQLCKTILPAYSQDLLKLFLETRKPGIYGDSEKDAYFEWQPPGYERTTPLRFATCKDIEYYERGNEDSDSKVTLAVAAFVEEARPFTYGGDERKAACEVLLDVDGGRFRYVKWAGKDRKIPAIFSEALKGAVVVAIITKYKSDRPFSIEDLVIVEQPFDPKNTDGEDSEDN